MDWCRTGSDSDQTVVVKREESMKANLSICHQLCSDRTNKFLDTSSENDLPPNGGGSPLEVIWVGLRRELKKELLLLYFERS